VADDLSSLEYIFAAMRSKLEGLGWEERRDVAAAYIQDLCGQLDFQESDSEGSVAEGEAVLK
jgi:hypothetical protein